MHRITEVETIIYVTWHAVLMWVSVKVNHQYQGSVLWMNPRLLYFINRAKVWPRISQCGGGGVVTTT